jgi:hypothetical protein
MDRCEYQYSTHNSYRSLELDVQAKHARSHRALGFYKREAYSPINIYFASLFLAEIIQAIGFIMDVHWVLEGKVYSGSFCDAQGGSPFPGIE